MSNFFEIIEQLHAYKIICANISPFLKYLQISCLHLILFHFFKFYVIFLYF